MNSNERIRAAVMRAGHECKSFEPLPHIIGGAPFVYGKYSCVTFRIWNENLHQKPLLAAILWQTDGKLSISKGLAISHDQSIDT